MAYIGRDTDKISNVEVLDNITFDGSSSYTLQKGGSNFTPSSANTLLVSINGVVQAGNFTVSGSTIDFGTAVAGTSTCDFILHYGIGLITTPSDGTVTTAKLADSSVSLAKLTATGTKDATTFLRGDNTFAEPGGGIENITTFMMTTNFTLSSGINHISTNWSTYGASLGSSVTESSGIFSFPQTGFYMVITNFALYRIQADSAYVGLRIDTTNNNSTYTNKTRTYTAVNDSADFHSNLHQEYIFDVTDIANDKLKVNYESELGSNIRLIGNSTVEQTTVKFIRLGDT